mmetsp:Transcript_130160/g.278147  ORF Transcript_130160/g.278147 Transcript_130160/m.278147 type:complete len:228 (-) Transcript_130160:1236-1919(-)
MRLLHPQLPQLRHRYSHLPLKRPTPSLLPGSLRVANQTEMASVEMEIHRQACSQTQSIHHFLMVDQSQLPLRAPNCSSKQHPEMDIATSPKPLASSCASQDMSNHMAFHQQPCAYAVLITYCGLELSAHGQGHAMVRCVHKASWGQPKTVSCIRCRVVEARPRKALHAGHAHDLGEQRCPSLSATDPAALRLPTTWNRNAPPRPLAKPQPPPQAIRPPSQDPKGHNL